MEQGSNEVRTMPYIKAAKSGPHSGKRAATLLARPIAMPACTAALSLDYRSNTRTELWYPYRESRYINADRPRRYRVSKQTGGYHSSRVGHLSIARAWVIMPNQRCCRCSVDVSPSLQPAQLPQYTAPMRTAVRIAAAHSPSSSAL